MAGWLVDRVPVVRVIVYADIMAHHGLPHPAARLVPVTFMDLGDDDCDDDNGDDSNGNNDEFEDTKN